MHITMEAHFLPILRSVLVASACSPWHFLRPTILLLICSDDCSSSCSELKFCLPESPPAGQSSAAWDLRMRVIPGPRASEGEEDRKGEGGGEG